jgi:predicted dienelactone hydrolase
VTKLTAAPSIEPQAYAVGRRSTLLVDTARDNRVLGVDVWYPAAVTDEPMAMYELFPGVAFEAAGARHEPEVAPGNFPLILFSHGRTGMRFAYSLLSEALAARGAVVVSADHPGDALSDWLLGTNVDDRTNEMNRVGDARFVLDSMLAGPGHSTGLPDDLLGAIDQHRIAVAGHSYGAYTALAIVAGARGVAPDLRVGAVVGLQAYTRTMSDSALGRVHAPTLLVVAENDTATPPESDADRPWALLPGEPVWRVDLAAAGHQASSDMGLYAELAHQVTDLPQIVVDYLESSAADAVGPGLRPWREGLLLQVQAIWAFLNVVLDLAPSLGESEAERLAACTGVTLQRR